MDLTIIAAISENNVIGNKGKIPWRIEEDMKRFKYLTIGHPVIMGRKTYESIPRKFRPLPERKNIVLSRDYQSDEKIYVARDINEALKLTDRKDSFVIGGEIIYELFLPFANKMELTRVHDNFEGDVFFPEVNWKEWKLMNEEKHLQYSFLSYSRTKRGIYLPQ